MPKRAADEEGLLAAICVRPDDDMHRLVYADWLDENGRHERASFIRYQIAEAAADPTALRGPSEWHRRNELDLLTHLHAKEWLKELPKWVQQTVLEEGLPAYRRGFVERLAVKTSPFLTFGGRLIHSYPVRELRFMEVGRMMPRLMTLPWVSRLRAVSFAWEPLGPESVAALVYSEYMAGPECLDLRYTGLTDAGLRTLARAPWLNRLTTLRLGFNLITWVGLDALTAAGRVRATLRIELDRHGEALSDARQLLAGQAVWCSPSPGT